MTFLAKSTTSPAAASRLAHRRVLQGVGQLPIDRSGGKASDAALRSGLRVLRRGELLGIYPEGTRSPRRAALPGPAPASPDVARERRPGAAGGDDRHRQGAADGQEGPEDHADRHPHRRPLDFSRYEGMENDRFVLRSVTDEIMYELMLLSGQEYVDEYATSAKERLLKAARIKARELQEAARPGAAARELEDALAAADGDGDGYDGLTTDPVAAIDHVRSAPTPATGPTRPPADARAARRSGRRVPQPRQHLGVDAPGDEAHLEVLDAGPLASAVSTSGRRTPARRGGAETSVPRSPSSGRTSSGPPKYRSLRSSRRASSAGPAGGRRRAGRPRCRRGRSRRPVPRRRPRRPGARASRRRRRRRPAAPRRAGRGGARRPRAERALHLEHDLLPGEDVALDRVAGRRAVLLDLAGDAAGPRHALVAGEGRLPVAETAPSWRRSRRSSAPVVRVRASVGRSPGRAGRGPPRGRPPGRRTGSPRPRRRAGLGTTAPTAMNLLATATPYDSPCRATMEKVMPRTVCARNRCPEGAAQRESGSAAGRTNGHAAPAWRLGGGRPTARHATPDRPDAGRS